jgi:hypothetical protein
VIAQEPTFASIDCRFEALGAAMSALGDVTPRAPVLRDRLGKADGIEQNARAFCAGGDAKHAKKSLKSAFRKLGRLRALLASKASRSIPGRDELLATVDSIRNDMRTLKGRVSCPADVRTPAP